MGKLKYEGDKLYSLLNDSWEDFHRKWPGVKYNTWKGKRAYHKNKIKEGKIEMPPKPEQEPQTESTQGNDFGDILKLHNMSPELANELDSKGFHVGYIKNANGEIEYTIPLPNGKGGNTAKLSEFISQAPPAKITPSRRKPVNRDYKLIFAFGDLQIDYRQIDDELVPLHDERMINIINMMCKEFRPETIVDLSDTLDFAAISRFPADSDHFRHSLNPAINRVHNLYAQLRADNPESHIVAVDSNHTIRLARFLMKQVPELYGVRQAGNESKYPAMTYPFLVNMEAVDVDWYGGYGAAEFVYGEEYNAPPIIFKHGTTVVSGGSTAAKESRDNPETHIVRGHGHRSEVHHRTTRAGEYLTSMMVGCGCHTDGRVPSYGSGVDDGGKIVKKQENWQQSVGLITDYLDGTYQFDMIMVRDGIAKYNGKVYDGNNQEKEDGKG